MTSRTILARTAVSSFFILVLLAGAAGSSASPGSGPAIDLSPRSHQPRAGVDIRGAGFDPFETIKVTFDMDLLATMSTDASGRFSGAIVVPATATPGSHAVTAIGAPSGLTAATTFTVTTHWRGTWFDGRSDRWNKYENVLTPQTVADLHMVWRAEGACFSFSEVAAAGDRVYAGGGGSLSAMDVHSGRILWSVPFPGATTPLVDDGIVFASGRDSQSTILSAFVAESGSQVWLATFPYSIYGASPPVLANGMILLQADKLYAVDAKTGQVEWSTRTGWEWTSDVAVGAGLVFVNVQFEYVKAFDLATGEDRWTKWLTDTFAAPVYAEGTLYVSGKDDFNYTPYLYALDAATGDVRWAAEAGWSYTSPSVTDGAIYQASGDVVAFDRRTGADLWRVHAGVHMADPTVAGDLLYVGTEDGTLLVLDPTTGATLWTGRLGPRLESSPTIADGRVFVCTAHDDLVALGL